MAKGLASATVSITSHKQTSIALPKTFLHSIHAGLSYARQARIFTFCLHDFGLDDLLDRFRSPKSLDLRTLVSFRNLTESGC